MSEDIYDRILTLAVFVAICGLLLYISVAWGFLEGNFLVGALALFILVVFVGGFALGMD